MGRYYSWKEEMVSHNIFFCSLSLIHCLPHWRHSITSELNEWPCQSFGLQIKVFSWYLHLVDWKEFWSLYVSYDFTISNPNLVSLVFCFSEWSQLSTYLHKLKVRVLTYPLIHHAQHITKFNWLLYLPIYIFHQFILVLPYLLNIPHIYSLYPH